jgi:hypothetical protein
MVMFDNYWHGTWKYDKTAGLLKLTPENYQEPIVFKIDTLRLTYMELKLDSNNYKRLPDFRNRKDVQGSWFPDNQPVRIGLVPDKESYGNEEDDPYSEFNNKWRIKPTHSESDKEIKQRVMAHLAFFKLLFNDAYRDDKNYVTYDWFVSPVLPASNGIALKGYSKIRIGWEACFYDSTQARAGYKLLNDAFDYGLKIPTGDNRYLNSRDMLDEIIDNIKKITRK